MIIFLISLVSFCGFVIGLFITAIAIWRGAHRGAIIAFVMAVILALLAVGLTYGEPFLLGSSENVSESGLSIE